MQLHAFFQQLAQALDEILLSATVIGLEVDIQYWCLRSPRARENVSVCPGSSLCTPAMTLSVAGVVRKVKGD